MKLNERLSDIVYHYTSISNALKILKNNEFQLTTALRAKSEEDINKNHLYFLSTTRNRRGSYHKDKTDGVLFTLDGNKLNQNNKGISINYFSGMGYADNEMEDRLISNKPSIESLKFISRCDILIDKYSREFALYVYMLCRRNNIKVSIYEDRKDWLKQTNDMTFSEIKDLKLNTTPNERKFKSRYRNDVSKFYEALIKRNYHALSKDTKEFIDNMIQYPRDRDSIRNDIENRNKHDVVKLTEYMRKHKIKTLTSLLDDVFDFYKQEIQEENKRHRRKILQQQYQKDKDFHIDVLAVIKDKKDKLDEKYYEREHLVYKISDAIDLMGELGVIDVKSIWFDYYGHADRERIQKRFNLE